MAAPVTPSLLPPLPPLPLPPPIRKPGGLQPVSLQEQVRRSSAGNFIPAVISLPSSTTVSVPLCGLPTSPPNSAPAITSHNKPRPESATVGMLASHTGPTSGAVDTAPSAYLTKPVQTAPRYSISRSESSTQLSHISHRGHTRSKLSGPFTAFPSARTRLPSTTEVAQCTHTRNLSSGNISQGLQAANGQDTPELSKSSASLSRTFHFDSHLSQAPPPNPEKGYDFAKHFNLFSPFTSNMALEYCQGERSPEVQECPSPAVWCMDVWNNSIAVGCGNGQIEVGVALSHVTVT